MATVLVTGGTGLIGRHLSHLLLQKGYSIIILTRKKPGHATPNITYAEWDVSRGLIDKDAVMKSDYIIHLAGAGVADERWSAKRKQEIVDSRVKSSELLVKTLQENQHHVKATVSASGIGWYGGDNDASRVKGFTEEAEPDKDFLGETCRLWEQSIEPVQSSGIRLVKMRTGLVLSNDGGALAEFKKPLKFGIAGILGGGDQVMSWIHIDDICRMYLYALQNEQVSGAYNAVAPTPVTNKELTLQTARTMRGKRFIPIYVPSFVLKLILGEMSIEVLKSATVSDSKIRATGFRFLYPSLEAALNELLRNK
ncbi:TIGR01777 family oxidoreductase [Foetidibacter luteolus]|uniref:TIGR01777 family oxidoreductase n=1 Tax=Foetidibacter luteolus TaxID=2608880 RepID=UPI00129AC14C|nr:TIGR01777 family oxidoreductase [Foetidibacter luteolus]